MTALIGGSASAMGGVGELGIPAMDLPSIDWGRLFAVPPQRNGPGASAQAVAKPAAKAADHAALGVASAAKPAAELIPSPPPEPPVDRWANDHDTLDQYIEFRTPEAEAIVREYYLNCAQPGKTLRLMDVLRAAAREGSYYEGAYMLLTADSRGDEVRIYQQIHTPKIDTAPQLYISLDTWGEMRLYRGIGWDSVRFLCHF